jgi:hypothetical protein
VKWNPATLAGGDFTVTSVGRASASLPLVSPLLSPPLAVTYADINVPAPVVSAPDLAGLLEGFDYAQDMSTFPTHIRQLFGTLQGSANGAALANVYPLIGDALGQSSALAELGEALAQAIEDRFQSGDRSAVAVQQVLDEFFGLTGGAGEHDPVMPADHVSLPPGTLFISRTLTYKWIGAQPGLSGPLALGVPGFATSSEAYSSAYLTLENLRIGATRAGAFLDLSHDARMSFEIVATLPDAHRQTPMTATQGNLQVGVQDARSGLTEAVRIDLPRAGYATFQREYAQGDILSVDVEPLTASRAYISVQGPSGYVATQEGSRAGERTVLNVSLPATGEYSVLVYEPSSEGPASFQVHLASPRTHLHQTVQFDLFDVAPTYNGDGYLTRSELSLIPGIASCGFKISCIATALAAQIVNNPELAPVSSVRLSGAGPLVPDNVPVDERQPRAALIDLRVLADHEIGFNHLGRPNKEIPINHAGPLSRTLHLVEEANYSTAAIDNQTLYVRFGGKLDATQPVLPLQAYLVARFLGAGGDELGFRAIPIVMGFRWSGSDADCVADARADVPAGTRSVRYELDIRPSYTGTITLNDAHLVVRNKDPLLDFGIQTSWGYDQTFTSVPDRRDLAETVALGQSAITITDFRLNASEAVRQFVKPMMDQMQAVVKFIEQPLRALDRPFLDRNGDGVINDQDFAANGINDTIDRMMLGVLGYATIAEIAAGPVVGHDRGDLLATIDAILRVDPTVSDAAFISLGGIRIDLNGYDPLRPDPALFGNIEYTVLPTSGTWPDVTTLFDQAIGGTAFDLSNIRTNENGVFQLDVVRDADRLVDLLLGRPTTIVAYHLPKIDLEFTVNKSFGHMEIWDFARNLAFRLQGSFRVRADFKFGFDNISGPFIYTDVGNYAAIKGRITVDKTRWRS